MPTFRAGRVTAILSERAGLQRVLVAPDGPVGPPPVLAEGGDDAGERAYVLTELVGSVDVGDDVVVNTTAVDLGLGTGGWHVVHWNLSRRTWTSPGPGHIVKLRYTSLQTDTGAAEELVEPAADLGGVPVVVGTLHSQVPCIAAAFLARRPGGRVVYVMTDGAALPMALSDLVVAMQEAGALTATVTAGHAFGGDLEAVSVPSALGLAVAGLHADLVVVAMGPGVVGTGTALGTTSVEAAAALDAAAALGGRPLLAVRASGADPRPRHRGVSHHVATVLDLVRTPLDVPVPPGLALEHPRHRVFEVDPGDVPAELERLGLHVTSMGRGPADDPLFYAAAGAAGAAAAGPSAP